MSFLGVDAKKFVREGISNDFVALTGIGVEVEDYERFKKEYIEIIQKLLEKRGITPEKKAYKSYDLKKLNIDEEFYEEFYEEIKTKIEKIYVCYSYFSQKNGKRVEIYPFDRKHEINIMDFMIDHLDPGYPHVCLWEIMRDGFTGKCFLDGINGKVTNAWNEIEKNVDFSILPNEDKTNALISSADILTVFLDIAISKNQQRLDKEGVEKVFESISDKLKIFFVSNACLYSIIPLSEKQNIPFIKKIAHPTFYIIKEKSKYVDDKAIENSPLIKKVADLCFSKNGCFKFFDPRIDHEAICSEDYLITFSKAGDESAESLKAMGYKFTKVSLDDLDSLE